MHGICDGLKYGWQMLDARGKYIYEYIFYADDAVVVTEWHLLSNLLTALKKVFDIGNFRIGYNKSGIMPIHGKTKKIQKYIQENPSFL